MGLAAAVRQELEVFVRKRLLSGYGHNKLLGHDGLRGSMHFKADGVRTRGGGTVTGEPALKVRIFNGAAGKPGLDGPSKQPWPGLLRISSISWLSSAFCQGTNGAEYRKHEEASYSVSPTI
jgi:hypothetical protein